ncbi:retrotransposon protein [Cucumis melo var. makuwa]|uniref:Retrotransposon protein n=1 Tax=Cucumis melo var. makuwa TaxID=1194695 RepID=A0A5A7T2C1_CUCMM|nr:retrotransposon protein [Cucumis melo var. makuwa]TYK05552.1 retrotransposon protein [Cucumis melo var. makuwa]
MDSLTKPFPIKTNLHMCADVIGRRVALLRHLLVSGLTNLLGMRGLTHPCTIRRLTCLRKTYAHHDLLARQTTIVKRPAHALANDTNVCQEFLRLLREMFDLSSLDRALYQRQLMSRINDMRDFVEMTDEERKNFCRVLLRDISR